MRKVYAFLKKYMVQKPYLFILILILGTLCFVYQSSQVMLNINSVVYGTVISNANNTVIYLKETTNSIYNDIYIYENHNESVFRCSDYIVEGNYVKILSNDICPYNTGTNVCIEYSEDKLSLLEIIFTKGGSY